MTNAKKLLMNTVLLTAASFVMRTVTVSFNVYLTNKIGADGIGLFQLVFTVYSLAITFAGAGVRLAAMRMTADNSATGKYNHRQLMTYCIAYSLICGIVTAAVMKAGADLIGQKWIEDPRSIRSLKILCISLPFVSVSMALNGYFTSVGKLVRYTAVQLGEQILKIIITVLSLKKVLSEGIEASCAAVTFGIITAQIFSALCSYILYRISVCKPVETEKPKDIISSLLRISVPDATGAVMRSILMTVEHLLIPVGFRKSGSNPQAALATYGIIHGMSLPLILYPSALLSSLSGLLVPEISSHYVAGNKSRIEYMIARVLHLTLIFSIGTSGIMYFNAENLSLAVYSKPDAAFYVQILSPLIPVMYTDMSVDGMLKGLDQQVSYMRYNIIDSALCVMLVYLLVPVFSVKGYIIVVFVSETVNFFLSFRRLTIVADVKIDCFRDIVIPLLCVISANLFRKIFFALFPLGFDVKLCAFFEITVSAALYSVLLIMFRSVDSEEIYWAKRVISH